MAKGTDKLDSQITQESGAEADLRQLKDDDFGSQRVYKKTSPNSLLTLYLGTRDVICRHGNVEPLRGVIYIDPKFTPSNKIYGQLTLTFRYGREDEEVMGLKFCNEAIIALKQIWPVPDDSQEDLSALQQALLDRLGKNAFPFSLDVGALAPPSVQLVPAKRYNGAPIGTSYDVRIHMGDPNEERPSRRCMVKLGVRVIHKITSTVRCAAELTTALNAQPAHHTVLMPKTLRLRLSPKTMQMTTGNNSTSATVMMTTTAAAAASAAGGPRLSTGSDAAAVRNGGSESRIDVERSGGGAGDNDLKGPEGSVDKPFLWTEGRVSLRAALNKSAYGHGEHISVTIDVRNDSRKIIRKMRIFAVQHVDVCMFSNGKFKNIVAEINESLVIKPSEHHCKVYSLLPIRGPTKNWIAVEGSQSQGGGGGGGGSAGTGGVGSSECSTTATMQQYSCKIASSAPRGPDTCTEDRNVFAIYVSYYIKVKLTLSAMGGEVTLKLPFILGHVEDNYQPAPIPLRVPDKSHSDIAADPATPPAASDIKSGLSEPQSLCVKADAEPTASHCPCQPGTNSQQPSAATLDDIIEVATTTTTTTAPTTTEVSDASAAEHVVCRRASYYKGDAASNEPSICNVVMAQVHSSAN